MSQSIFKYSSYVKYLNDLSAAAEIRGILSRWAEAAGCQRSYLSNVLGGRAGLNRDQGFRLSEFLRHTERERNYFLLLVELEKDPSPSYKEYLRGQLAQLKREEENLQKKLERPAFQPEGVQSTYYSSWHRSAIHILVSIPEFQTISSISEHLGISSSLTEKILEELVSMGFVARNGSRYSWQSGDIHVPEHSPLVTLHHQHWRLKAIEDAQMKPADSVHFTSVYSLSRTDLEDVKFQILDMIKNYHVRARASKEEILVCFNADLFEVKKAE